MKTYLVGGAVRDMLLGIEPKDKDFVVVGATVKQMLDHGFQQVGHDFPVFLHPQTKEEYALARTEHKCGIGHKGFVCDFNPDVSLAHDLVRRDLTINAIAYDGIFHDPMNGRDDLEKRILRHCSESFADDPLRVLRVARFKAQYFDRGFMIHDDTLRLMKHMVANGELDHLTPERVWQETLKALNTKNPSAYFDTLLQCDALKVLFPEVEALLGVDQPAEHHPEIDTYLHVMMCIDLASKRGLDAEQKFALLMHDLGKGITPKEMLPHHYGHEEAGVPLVEAVCARLRVPNSFKWLAVNASRYHLNIHTIKQLNYKSLVNKLMELGAAKYHDRFVKLLQVCKLDAQGRLGFEDKPYPQEQYALGAASVLDNLKFGDLAQTMSGAKLVEAIRKRRYGAMRTYLTVNNQG